MLTQLYRKCIKKFGKKISTKYNKPMEILKYINNPIALAFIVGPIYSWLEIKNPQDPRTANHRPMLERFLELKWELFDRIFSKLWFMLPLAWLYYEHVNGFMLRIIPEQLHFVFRLKEMFSFQIGNKFLYFVIALFLNDFANYVVHVIYHRSKLWDLHILHHSPVYMEWSTQSRFHFLEGIIGAFIRSIILFFLVTDIQMAAWITFFELNMSYFIHSNVKINKNPFLGIFTTPLIHHWHHAKVCIYKGGQNFGFCFVIWDKLFGTYYCPDHSPEEYGISVNYPEGTFARIFWPIFKKEEKSERNS